MKKNSMKKNRMLRLASTLMILTLLTTSIIGGTFAKYTTAGSASDTARVAKWGVVINASGSLYSDAYAVSQKADDGITEIGNLPVAWETSPAANAITVSTKENNTADNIVAPGTKSYGNGLSFSISGTPEVAVKVKTTIKAEDIYLKAGHYGVLVRAEVSDLESVRKIINNGKDVYFEADATDGYYTKVTDDHDNYGGDGKYYILTDRVDFTDDYYPVQYKLEGGVTENNKTARAIAYTLASKLLPSTTESSEAYRVSYDVTSDSYPANTNLATVGPQFSNEKMGWVWPFEDGTTATDAKDTILGDLIALQQDRTLAYKVVSCTVDGSKNISSAKTLTFGSGDDAFTVKNGDIVVANLRTLFDITLTVEQVD